MTEWKWVGVFLLLAVAIFAHASVSRYSIVVEEISGSPVLIYRLDSLTGHVEMEVVARKFHPYPSWLTAPDGSEFQPRVSTSEPDPTVSTPPESLDLTPAEKVQQLFRERREQAASPAPQ